MVRSRKIKIQVEDDEGSKYSITLEGNLNKDKVLKFMELIELIDSEHNPNDNFSSNSVGEKIWHLIEEYCFGEFTSSKLLELYEDVYNEPIKLSVISTYLSRFSNRNLLTRVRGRNEWIYRRTKLNQH